MNYDELKIRLTRKLRERGLYTTDAAAASAVALTYLEEQGYLKIENEEVQRHDGT